MSYKYTLNLNASIQELETVKIMFEITEKYKPKSLTIKNIFVAGCGDGTEASAIRNSLKVNVVGVDNGLLNEYEDDTLKVLSKDLMNLSFDNDSFDMVYSYHVLEHVPDPNVVLKKLAMMTRKNGTMIVGFPNKNRLVGYLGSKNATTLDKIKWNFIDYKYRMLSKWENKFGAHAGFTSKEFMYIAQPYFSKIIPVSNDYFFLKYKNNPKLISLIIKSGFDKYLFPTLYFVCLK